MDAFTCTIFQATCTPNSLFPETQCERNDFWFICWGTWRTENNTESFNIYRINYFKRHSALISFCLDDPTIQYTWHVSSSTALSCGSILVEEEAFIYHMYFTAQWNSIFSQSFLGSLGQPWYKTHGAERVKSPTVDRLAALRLEFLTLWSVTQSLNQWATTAAMEKVSHTNNTDHFWVTRLGPTQIAFSRQWNRARVGLESAQDHITQTCNVQSAFAVFWPATRTVPRGRDTPGFDSNGLNAAYIKALSVCLNGRLLCWTPHCGLFWQQHNGSKQLGCKR